MHYGNRSDASKRVCQTFSYIFTVKLPETLFNLTHILKVITYLSGVSNIDLNSSHVRAYDACHLSECAICIFILKLVLIFQSQSRRHNQNMLSHFDI